MRRREKRYEADDLVNRKRSWRDDSNGSKRRDNEQEARHVPRSATRKVDVGEAKAAGEADSLRGQRLGKSNGDDGGRQRTRRSGALTKFRCEEMRRANEARGLEGQINDAIRERNLQVYIHSSCI